jgi:hypothetical protein
MAGIITVGINARRYLPGLNTIFGYQYNLWPEEFSEFMDIKTSEKAYEDVLGQAGMGVAVIKNETQSITYYDFKQGIAARFVPVLYGKGFVISMEAMEDDLYAPGLVEIGGKFMAKSMKVTKEIACANLLNNGFGTTGFNSIGGDGVSLFSSSHKLYKSTNTYSNQPSQAGDLSELTLEQAAIDIGNLVDDAGLRMECRPQKLIIARQDEFNAARILKSTLQNDTANNATNALREQGTIPGGVHINHYLTSTSAWFLTTSEQSMGCGMILMMRKSLQTDATNDFDTKNVKFSGTERYVPYWADGRCVYGSAGS